MMQRIIRLYRRAISRVQQRGINALLRALRLTGAAVAAYVVAGFFLDDTVPVIAALTALLVVEVTLFDIVTSGVQRVVSVVAGVLLAVGFSSLVGISWWSLGILVAVSILVGQLLRLGPHLVEVPISAMLVLAVGGEETVASDRIIETLIGAAVGVAVNIVFPPGSGRIPPPKLWVPSATRSPSSYTPPPKNWSTGSARKRPTGGWKSHGDSAGTSRE